MKPFLTIVIPAYNEAKNFHQGALKKVNSYLDKCSFNCKVLIIDDGSQDRTVALIRNFIQDKKNWKLLEKKHEGKAAAVAFGVKKARGENILFADFDQATPLSEVEKLIPFLEKGYQVVIGSREIEGAKREDEPLLRHLMGKVFNIVVQLFALPGIHDTQCGFKLFKTETAKKLFSKLQIKHQEKKRAFTGAFDVEILYLARKYDYKIAEVPIYWSHFKTDRVSALQDSMRMFFDVMKIRLYDLLGKYELKS